VLISRFIRGSSALSTSVVPRRFRFVFGDFFVKIWLANAFLRLSFPDTVRLKRFFAPLFDFILGIPAPPIVSLKWIELNLKKYGAATHTATNSPSRIARIVGNFGESVRLQFLRLCLLLYRSEYRRHSPAFHSGFLVNFRNIRQFFQKTPQEVHSVVFINNVSAAKLYVRPDLITVEKKFASVFGLELEIVNVRMRAKTNFFQFYVVRFFPGFFFFFLLFVPEFAIIHDLANRWLGVRGDFDEIQVSFICEFDRIFQAINAVFAAGINNTNGLCTDLVVYTDSFLCDGNTCLFKLMGKYTA